MSTFNSAEYFTQHGKEPVTPIKNASGYTVKLMGEPEAWSDEAIAALCLAQTEPVKATAPKGATESGSRGKTRRMFSEQQKLAVLMTNGVYVPTAKPAKPRKASKAEERAAAEPVSNGQPVSN